MNAATNSALERLYVTFSVQPRPDSIEICECCVSDKQIRALLSTPLRQISEDQLSDYASSVFVTGGDVADFKYFLPRILELVSSNDSFWPCLEVAFKSIERGGWLNWPEGEQEALRAFFDAEFDKIASDSSDDGYRMDAVICGLGLSGIEVRPFLTRLEQPLYKDACIHFIEQNSDAMMNKKLGNAFWDFVPFSHAAVAHEHVLEWLQSDTVQLIILRHYDGGLSLPDSA